jgi:hypothetical protein
MFDEFDIDYNQYKYLLETRASGALTKIRSAVVSSRLPRAVLVTPAVPTFDPDTSQITIHDTTGVTYRRSDTNVAVTNAGFAVHDGLRAGLTIYCHGECGLLPA